MSKSYHFVCVDVCHSVMSDSVTLWTNLPGSYVHAILQARVRKWVSIFSSRGSSQPRDQNQVSCIAGRFFTIWATREYNFIYVNVYTHICAYILLAI